MLQDANVLSASMAGTDPDVLVGIYLPADKADEYLQDPNVIGTYKQYLH